MHKSRTPAQPAPHDFSSVDAWAEQSGLSVTDGRRRLFQLAALRCIAADEWLRKTLVLRGSTLLWAAYGNVRTANDVDFLALSYRPGSASPVLDEIRRRVSRAMSVGMSRVLPNFIDIRDEVMREVKVEVTPFYMPFVVRPLVLPDGDVSVQACDLEFAVVEKLIALGEQTGCARQRGKDLYDLFHVANLHTLDERRMRAYGKQRFESYDKPRAWLPAGCEELRAWTRPSFDAAAATVPGHPVQFEDACAVWERLASEADL